MTVKEANDTLGRAQAELWNLGELLMALEMAALAQSNNKAPALEWDALIAIAQKQLSAAMPMLSDLDVYLNRECVKSHGLAAPSRHIGEEPR